MAWVTLQVENIYLPTKIGDVHSTQQALDLKSLPLVQQAQLVQEDQVHLGHPRQKLMFHFTLL